jgi:release factor family 3
MAVLTRDPAQAPLLSAVTREEIRSLVEAPGRPCVSIYMPTFRAGAETLQNPVRLKNLLRSVHERLVEGGMRNPEAVEFLAPLRALVDDDAFWQRQSDGLAVFRSPEAFRSYRLPISVDELAVVENRFHLKPLFSLLNGDGRFFVLALSINNIRLIAASHHSAEEVELRRVPRSLHDALGDLTHMFAQFKTGPRARAVSRSPVFHIHGGVEDDLKAEVLSFFNLADKALLKYMDRDAPVVLAGVDYLLPLYKETTEHPKVLEEGLLGNAELLSPDELRAAAWEIVEPLFLADRRRAVERYGDLLGTGRSVDRYEEIVPAAHDGRVDTLFVARGVRLWGSYDSKAREVRPQEDQSAQRNGSEDLLDLAAVQTFLNGGTVYAVPQREVPGGQVMAAIFRY